MVRASHRRFVVAFGFAFAALIGKHDTAFAFGACPTNAMIVSPDGKTYVAVVRGHVPFAGAAYLEIFGEHAAYRIRLETFAVATREAPNAYRSESVVFSNPLGRPLESFSFSFAGRDTPTWCTVEGPVFAPSRFASDARKAAAYADISPHTSPLRSEFARDVDPITCESPYQDPDIEDAVVPKYPVEARFEKVLGKVAIDVSLRADGSVAGADVAQSSGNGPVDIAAYDAARQTHYLPRLFRCQGRPSHLIVWYGL